MGHKSYELSINVSYIECERLYHEGNNTVVVHTVDGLRIQLPTMNLRTFVTPDGIQGRFRLVTTEDNKILSLTKI